MISAYHEIRNIGKKLAGGADLRAASMVSAIDKIAASYANRGIFP